MKLSIILLSLISLNLGAQELQTKTNGWKKNYFPTGELQSEGLLKADKEEGLWTFYFKTGEKRIEQMMKDGKRSGKVYWYHKNGNLGWEEYYKEGVAHGRFVYYSSDGNIRAEKVFEEGKEINFSVNGIQQRLRNRCFFELASQG